MKNTRIGVALLFVFFLTLSVTISHADEVSQVRAAIVAKQAQWQAGETSMTLLSPAERRARLGLVKPSEPVGAEMMVMAEPPLVGAPPSLDWRSNGGNFVTPVRNQGGCGSCWAFAATAALESLTLRVNNTPGVDLNLSEQVLVSCGSSGGHDAGSCSGGYVYPSYASDYIRDTGLPLETCYPYTATDGSCGSACGTYQTATYRIAGYAYVTTTSPTVSAIRDALVSYGPLATTMDVYEDFYSYTNGVYSYATGVYEGGHAVLIVGYNDAGQYFIVKNSWGANWGESGYFKIAYSELGTVVQFGEYTIAYSGTACTYSISPTSASFSASGGTGTVSVATQAGCTWSVSNSASWITITAGSSGTGSGNVSYTVASNSGSSARSAGLTIAGQTITVYESGQAPLVLSGSHDFNADGRPDLIWQSQATGQLAYWLMNGLMLQSYGSLFNNQAIDTNWKIVGIGDFNGDGKPDFIWHSQVTGQVRYWLMNGLTLQSYGALNNDLPNDPSWKIVCIGDFNGDGKPDIIWQSQATGQLAYWLMNGVTLQSYGSLFNNQAIDTNWKIVGCGDFNGDGKPDFIWHSQVTGQVRYWLMNGLTLQSYGALNNDLPNDPSWKIVGVFDLDGDGQTDLIWQSQVTGQVAYWLMNGVTLQNFGNLNNGLPNDPRWKIVGK
jgi:C1A family cysteine protease